MNDQTLIVFCGADKTGKTEIAHALSEKLGIPYFKASNEKAKFRNDKDFINEMRHADPRMLDFLNQTGYSLIMDRGWPCEWVYSRFLERPTDEEATRNSDRHFAEMGAKVIVCYRTNYEGLYDEDRPDLLTTQNLEYLSHLYHQFENWTLCDVYYLNVDDEDLDREVAEIMNFIETQKKVEK